MSGKKIVIIGSINITCCIGSICISYPVCFVRGVVTKRMENSVPSVATPHGKGVHDSLKGFGSTHSILRRRVNGQCSAQQSGYVSG